MVVFDDIQWGEETFHDLIEHVALLSSGASILLLCMARPALTEQRATWPVTLRLEPLPDDDVDELIPDDTPDDLRERISRAAGGNPLFVEEMVAMAGEAEGEVVVPPTLHALLAARLDQLEPARATHPRVRRDRGRDLPPGCRPGTRARRDAGHPAPRRARPQGADPAGQTADRGRGRLSLPPPADPRRGVRGAPQVVPRGSPSAPGRLAGGARDRARGARRDPRLPPGAGLRVPRRARTIARRRVLDRRRQGSRLTAAGRASGCAARTTGRPRACSERAAALVPPPEVDLALEIRARRRPCHWAGKARRGRSGARTSLAARAP